jgi:hypothetical protein
MKILILLDIEQTLTTDVVDGADLLPENIRKIQELSIFEGASLGLMSWAIHDWTESEKELFNDIRPWVETDTTKFHDEWILSMEDWVSMIFKHDNLRVERFEVNHIFSKEDVLFKLRKLWKAVDFDHIFLIDDAVDDHLSICLNDGTMVSTLNVNKL